MTPWPPGMGYARRQHSKTMKDARAAFRRQADFLTESRVFERRVDDQFFYSSL